jgi:ABC-type multidrug transport system ATPase subunit
MAASAQRLGTVEQARPSEAPARVGRPALVASGITKRWSRRQEPILDGVDLELPSGTALALKGVNGVGKTTLLRILAGLFSPDAGSVSIDGLDPKRNRRAYQSRLGFLSAGQGGLYARLSVENHLDYWGRLALLPPAERRHATTMALARFELLDIASNRVDRLSMGQRQRVRLAMAFMHGPRVVLLDEPANSLDEAGLALLVSVVGEFRERGCSVVWCAPSVTDLDIRFDAVQELVGGKLVHA